MGMKLTNQLMYSAISQTVGEDVIPVVKYLKDRKNISEFKIAEKVNQEVNMTRNMLYRLNNYNIASYIRKKDRQKGWYISYWTLNKNRIKDMISKSKNQQIEMLKERLEREEMNRNQFYICPSLCARLNFDQATDIEFRCPECGQLLKQQDNSKTIELLQKRIRELGG